VKNHLSEKRGKQDLTDASTLLNEVTVRMRSIAVLELVLIFPAALFMAALTLRNLTPLEYESAHSAQQLVMWYTGRMWTLWVLLLGLPFFVFVSGCAELLCSWNRDIVLPLTSPDSLAIVRAHWASLVIAATTMLAGGVLVIVVLHVLAN
jgi:hypothetical protein